MLYKYDNKTLQFKQISIKQYVLVFLAIALIFSSLGFTGAIKFNLLVEKIPIIIRLNEEEFNEENLKAEIKKLNLKFPEVVYKQAIVEGASKTGKRWQNPIFLNGNNFLGLKKSFYRPSTAINWNEHYYCIYDSWQDCLKDYCMFQAQNCKHIQTEQEYYHFLKELGYSVTENYTETLKIVK